MNKQLFWPSNPTDYGSCICEQNLSQYGKESDFEIERETSFGKRWLPLTYGTMLDDSDNVRLKKDAAIREGKKLGLK